MHPVIFTRVRPMKDGFSFLSINSRMGLMYRALKRPGLSGRRDRIQCAYFGFQTKEEASMFAQYVKEKYEAARVVVRESDRLPECAFEVKVWEFQEIMRLVFKCVEKQQPHKAA